MSKKITTEDYKLRLAAINNKNNTNIILKENIEYIGRFVKITHICTCGKEWDVSPNNILTSNTKTCGLCNSFAQWGIDNISKDFLEKYWDYENNTVDPWEISYGNSTIKIWIKCQEKEYHGSYDILPGSFINGNRCGYCKGSRIIHPQDSFGQYLIDMYGENALKLYWDYEQNLENPFLLRKNSHKKVYIYCQEKKYHNSYEISCAEFTNGSRCGYCNNKKIHPLDSLGKVLEDKNLLHIWSENNKKSPFEYAPCSNKKVYWKCTIGKHKNYRRRIAESNDADFRCPNCSYEQKESIMATTLKQVFKNEYKDTEWEYDAGFKTSKNITSRYDIFIPNINYLIECQSEYHDNPKQQKRDKLKKEYAINNGYNYMAIDKRDYTPLQAIQIFFPNIKEIPNYVDISKDTTRKWDLKEAQELLDKGYTYQETADIIGTSYYNIHGHIKRGVLIKPENYRKVILKKQIKVICLNKDNNIIKIYNSLTDAAIDIRGARGASTICMALKKKYKTAYGYKWMYYDELYNENSERKILVD